tara:strand:+ start:188 stop:802 length:615 start_codon:yes stop_codon:yes gene_type:complete
MYKIGITGSIGTGKSTIAGMFSQFKIPIFDADNEIKKILIKEEIKKGLKEIWPEVIKNNNLNKNKLKTIIFSNKNEKKKLEKLLYPFLKIEMNKFEKLNYRKKILVFDIPLIYETKSEKNYDLILLANCNKTLQKKRVLARDKISNSLFENITRSQMSFNEKIKFKPKIINTNNLKLFILIEVLLLIIKVLIRLKLRRWNRKEN